MVVSACIDQGPMMIYFGQEVGEPGAQAEGFSGDDGRTTMFDYWGVPQHQKWVNNLHYDGGQLSNEQKQLRQFYGDVLSLASTNQAITRGEYADLTTYNQSKGNFSPLVHAFVRYYEEEKLIIVSNFDSKMEAVKVEIPKELANEIGLSEGTAYVGRDLLRSGAEIGINEKLTMSMEIPAFSSYILKIK
jgi:hypothetical protein